MNSTDNIPTIQNVSAHDAKDQTHGSRKIFIPRADIYETKNTVELIADMPGVDEKSVDITLEQSVLTIHGTVESVAPNGYKSAFAEYNDGDYERSFKLNDEIDRDGIQASVKNGILRVTLTKAGPAKARKIEVKAN